MSATRSRVSSVVFHPGKQHSYEAAVASAKAGLLRAFVTGIYCGAGPFRPRWYGWLPGAQGDRIGSWLRRRSHPELPSSLVRAVPWFHFADALLSSFGRGYPNRRLGELLLDRWLSRRLPRFDGNLLHAFEGACLHSLQAARRHGMVAVLDVPSAHEYFVEVSRQERQPVDESWQSIERNLVRQERGFADFLLVASDLARRCLIENGVKSEKIVQLPYGVDASRFRVPLRARPTGDKFRVLCVGKINARKGVRYLLEAWRGLGLPNGELVLVGSADPYGERLLSQHHGSYRWLGNVNYHDLHREFQSADLFVCPSLAETGPLVVYEAMASALPVVTTENARAVVRDGRDGFVLPIRDSQGIAEHILYYYTHPIERRAMGEQARQRILSGYTWRHYHERLICAYEAMLDAGAPTDAIAELEDSWTGKNGTDPSPPKQR